MNWTFGIIAASLNPLASINKLIKMRRSLLKNKSMEEVVKKLHVISDYKFITIVNILFDMGFYDENLYSELKKFNSCRNKLRKALSGLL